MYGGERAKICGGKSWGAQFFDRHNTTHGKHPPTREGESVARGSGKAGSRSGDEHGVSQLSLKS